LFWHNLKQFRYMYTVYRLCKYEESLINRCLYITDIVYMFYITLNVKHVFIAEFLFFTT